MFFEFVEIITFSFFGDRDLLKVLVNFHQAIDFEGHHFCFSFQKSPIGYFVCIADILIGRLNFLIDLWMSRAAVVNGQQVEERLVLNCQGRFFKGVGVGLNGLIKTFAKVDTEINSISKFKDRIFHTFLILFILELWVEFLESEVNILPSVLVGLFQNLTYLCIS